MIVVSTGFAADADGYAIQISSVRIREHRSTTNLHLRWAVCYRNLGEGSLLQEENDTVTLLIPDRDRENREDFIWCVPIERQKWNKWYKLSEQFKTATPKEYGGVRYMNRMEGKNVKTILVMPNAQQSDDDVVTACAYLRMIKGMTCRMYVVRCTDDPLTGARLIERAAGADITLVEDMGLVEGEEEQNG